MEMTIGELIDRYTIEARKRLYGAQNKELLAAITKSLIVRFGQEAAEVITSAGVLGVINDSIAVLEWQVREGQNLSLEEIGRRAVLIRKLNNHRVKHKDALCDVFGEPASPLCFGTISEAEVGMVEPQEPALNEEKTKTS